MHAVDSCGFYNVTNAVDGLFCQWCRWWHLSYHQWPSILATILSIWVLAEVRFTQFVITAIFRHKCCLKWCSDAFLKGTVAYIVWFFVILILQLTADSAVKELWELVSMLPRHRYEHGVFLFPGAQCMLYNANRRRPVHLLLASLSTTGYSVSAVTSGRLNHIAHTRSDDETDRDEVLRAREL